MRGTVTAIVHALKYGGWRELAREMGSAMAEMRFEAPVERELKAVVPVPLSAARLRERGFNQAELLARFVAEHRDLPFMDDVLVRVRHTRRQARLAPRERLTNVAGAFHALDDRRPALEDAHLLVVDDVLTTAATVQDCVRALCIGGARAVSVLTFARARPELPRVAGRASGASSAAE
jgi:ComF family protein